MRNNWLKKTRKTLALSLTAVLAFEVVGAPIAQARTYESVWSSRMASPVSVAPTLRTPPSLRSFLPLNLNRIENIFPVKPELGRVVDVWAPRAGAKTLPVVLIQDIHNDPAVQKNIADILEAALNQNPEKKMVLGIEGAWNEIDLNAYADAAPFNQTRRATTAGLVDRNYISGAHHFALNQDPGRVRVVGIEDQSTYLKNLIRRDESEFSRRKMAAGLSFLEDRMDRISAHFLPGPLRDFEKRRKDFAIGKIELTDYARYLGTHISLQRFPMLARYQSLVAMDEEAQTDASANAANAFMKKVIAAVGEDSAKTLLSSALAVKEGRLTPADFYQQLKSAAAQLNLAFPDELQKMLVRLEGREKMKGTVLLRDLHEAEEAVREKLSANVTTFPELNHFLALSQIISRQKKLWALELTPHEMPDALRDAMDLDWVAEEDWLRNLESGLGLNPAPYVIHPDYFQFTSSVMEYYTLAKRRDNNLAGKTLSARPKSDELVVLMAGGFHTDGIANQLRDANRPYVVVQPNVERTVKDDPAVVIEGGLPNPWDFISDADIRAATTPSDTLVNLMGPSAAAPGMDPAVRNALQTAQTPDIRAPDSIFERTQDGSTIRLQSNLPSEAGDPSLTRETGRPSMLKRALERIRKILPMVLIFAVPVMMNANMPVNAAEAVVQAQKSRDEVSEAFLEAEQDYFAARDMVVAQLMLTNPVRGGYVDPREDRGFVLYQGLKQVAVLENRRAVEQFFYERTKNYWEAINQTNLVYESFEWRTPEGLRFISRAGDQSVDPTRFPQGQRVYQYALIDFEEGRIVPVTDPLTGVRGNGFFSADSFLEWADQYDEFRGQVTAEELEGMLLYKNLSSRFAVAKYAPINMVIQDDETGRVVYAGEMISERLAAGEMMSPMIRIYYSRPSDKADFERLVDLSQKSKHVKIKVWTESTLPVERDLSGVDIVAYRDRYGNYYRFESNPPNPRDERAILGTRVLNESGKLIGDMVYYRPSRRSDNFMAKIQPMNRAHMYFLGGVITNSNPTLNPSQDPDAPGHAFFKPFLVGERNPDKYLVLRRILDEMAKAERNRNFEAVERLERSYQRAWLVLRWLADLKARLNQIQLNDPETKKWVTPYLNSIDLAEENFWVAPDGDIHLIVGQPMFEWARKVYQKLPEGNFKNSLLERNQVSVQGQWHNVVPRRSEFGRSQDLLDAMLDRIEETYDGALREKLIQLILLKNDLEGRTFRGPKNFRYSILDGYESAKKNYLKLGVSEGIFDEGVKPPEQPIINIPQAPKPSFFQRVGRSRIVRSLILTVGLVIGGSQTAAAQFVPPTPEWQQPPAAAAQAQTQTNEEPVSTVEANRKRIPLFPKGRIDQQGSIEKVFDGWGNIWLKVQSGQLDPSLEMKNGKNELRAIVRGTDIEIDNKPLKDIPEEGIRNPKMSKISGNFTVSLIQNDPQGKPYRILVFDHNIRPDSPLSVAQFLEPIIKGYRDGTLKPLRISERDRNDSRIWHVQTIAGEEWTEEFNSPDQNDPDLKLLKRYYEFGDGGRVEETFEKHRLNPITGDLIPGRILIKLNDQPIEVQGSPRIDQAGRVTYRSFTIRANSEDPLSESELFSDENQLILKKLSDTRLEDVASKLNQVTYKGNLRVLRVSEPTYEPDGQIYSRVEPAEWAPDRKQLDQVVAGKNLKTYFDVDKQRTGKGVKEEIPLYQVIADDPTPNQFGTTGKAVAVFGYERVQDFDGLTTSSLITEVRVLDLAPHENTSPDLPSIVANTLNRHGVSIPDGQTPYWKVTRNSLKPFTRDPWGGPAAALRPDEVEDPNGVVVFRYRDGVEAERVFVGKNIEGRFNLLDGDRVILSSPDSVFLPDRVEERRFDASGNVGDPVLLSNESSPAAWAYRGRPARSVNNAGLLEIQVEKRSGEMETHFEDIFNRKLIIVRNGGNEEVITPPFQFVADPVRGQWKSIVGFTLTDGQVSKIRILDSGDELTPAGRNEGVTQQTVFEFHLPQNIMDFYDGERFVFNVAPSREYTEVRDDNGVTVTLLDPIRNIFIENDVENERKVKYRDGDELNIEETVFTLENDSSVDKVGTYQTTEQNYENGMYQNLVIRRDAVGDNLFEEQIFERAPFGQRTSFGTFMGVLQPREIKLGRVRDGQDVELSRVYIFYGSDVTDTLPDTMQEWHALIQQQMTKYDLDGINPNSEIGRIHFHVGENGELVMESVFLNAGTHLTKLPSGENQWLLHVLELSDEYAPLHHWVDPTGKDVLQRKKNAYTWAPEDGLTYDPIRFNWSREGSILFEQKPYGFDAGIVDLPGNEEIVAGTTKKVEEVRLSEFFKDRPNDLGIVHYKELPSSLVGDPENQHVDSYYDPDGNIFLEHQDFGPDDTYHRMTYFVQQEAPAYQEVEKGMTLPTRFNSISANDDMVVFWAKGENLEGLRVRVSQPGKSVVLTNDPNSLEPHSFWSPVFDNPIVLANNKTGHNRFVDVRPMSGKVPLFPVNGNPHLMVISMDWLRSWGLDPSQVTFSLESDTTVEVSPLERLAPSEEMTNLIDPNFKLDSDVQDEFYTPGIYAPGIPVYKNRIFADDHGIVTVIRGQGTQTQIWVLDQGIPVSLTYWQYNGKDFDIVRVSYSSAISPFLRIPQFVESQFAGWLSRGARTIQMDGGRLQIWVANVDKAVKGSMFPSDMANPNKPADLYFPLGLFNPNSPFPDINANIVNGLLRKVFPSVESEFGLFPEGVDPTELAPRNLNPYEVKALVEGNPLNIPPSYKDWPFPEAIEVEGREFNQTHDQWVQTMDNQMNRATGLIQTQPGTVREKYVDTVQEGEIIEGYLRTGKVDSAVRIIDFYRRVSQNGRFHIVSGYQWDTGTPLAYQPEWRKPGIGVQTVSANIAVAKAALKLAEQTGNPEDWEFAYNVTQRAFDYIPENDYFWYEGDPAEMAGKLVAIWDSIRFPKIVGDALAEAQKKIKENKSQEARIRQEYTETIINQLSLNEETKEKAQEELNKNSFWTASRPEATARQFALTILHGRAGNEDVTLSPDFGFIRRQLTEARSELEQKPENTREIREKYTNILADRLTTNHEDRKILENILAVGGGLSEYLPRNPVVVGSFGITLMPEPDYYKLSAMREGLLLFKEWRTVLNAVNVESGPLIKFSREITIAEQTLEQWFEENVAPLMLKEDGLTPAYWRQQLWISGAAVTGQEGRQQPYVFMAGRWVTADSALTALHTALLIDRDKYEPVVKNGLENILKLFGSQKNGVSGLDFTPVTFGRPQGAMFSSHLTSYFGILSREVGFERGVEFAEKSLTGFVKPGSPLIYDASGVDAKQVDNVYKGFETGDGEVILPTKDGNDLGVSPRATLTAIELTNEASVEDVTLNPDKINFPDSLNIKEESGVPFLLEYGVLAGIYTLILGFITGIISTFTLIKQSATKKDKSPNFLVPLFTSKDGVGKTFLTLLPFPFIFALMGFSPLGFSIAGAWAFEAAKLLYTFGTVKNAKQYAEKNLKGRDKMDEGPRLYSDQHILDSNARWTKRVEGSFRVTRKDEGGNSIETDLIGSAVPRQILNGPLDGKGNSTVGTGEFAFMVGLRYIHMLSLEFYRRQNPDWDIAGEDLPSVLSEMKVSSQNGGKFELPISDPSLSADQPEMYLLDQYARKIGEWFRYELDKDVGDSHIFAQAELYFSQQAEDLRKILIRATTNNPSGALSPDDIRDFQEKLNELGVGNPSELDSDEISTQVQQFSGRFNLISIHPNWLEAAAYFPRAIIGFIVFGFIYSRHSLSPVSLVFNSFVNLSTPLQTLGGIFLAIGLISLAASYFGLAEGHFLKDRAKFTGIRKLLAERPAARTTLAAGLLIGIVGVIILTPGLMNGIGEMSMDVTSLILPLALIFVFLFEFGTVITNRISFVYLIRYMQFKPSQMVGSPAAIMFMVSQYVAYLGFGWWVSSYVAPYFEGSLISLWGPLGFMEPGFNLRLTIMVAIGIWALFALFVREALKLRDIEEKWKKQFTQRGGINDGIYFVRAWLAWTFNRNLPKRSVVREKSDFERLKTVGQQQNENQEGLDETGLSKNDRRSENILSPEEIREIISGNFKSSGWYFISLLAVVTFGVVYPLGSFVVGGLALLVALTLAHGAIMFMATGLTAVAGRVGERQHNFVELVAAISISLASWLIFYQTGIGITLGPVELAANQAVLNFIFLGGFFFGLSLAIGIAHPAFAALIVSSGIGAFLSPEWAGTPYFLIAFFAFLSLGILTRAANFLMVRKRGPPNPDNIPKDNFMSMIVTGGQPMRGPSVGAQNGNGAVETYMKMWNLVVDPNSFDSKNSLLRKIPSDLNERREKVRAALQILFDMEAKNSRTLFGEEAIVVEGAPLTPLQEKLSQATDEAGRNLNFLFVVKNNEEAELLRLGHEIQRYLVTRIPIQGSQRDTMFFTQQLTAVLKDRKLNDKVKIYIQANKFNRRGEEKHPEHAAPQYGFDEFTDEYFENKEKNLKKQYEEVKDINPALAFSIYKYELEKLKEEEINPMRGKDKQRLLEFDERLALAKYLQITTDVDVEVTFNWSFAGMKSAAQNGNGGDLLKGNRTFILDRNAQSFELDKVANDIQKILENEDVVGIVPSRSTANTAFPTGKQSDLGEDGFSNFSHSLITYLGGEKGEMIAIGWGQMVQSPLIKMMRAFSHPSTQYRFDVNAPPFVRDFGAIHGYQNLPHVSEDTVQQQFAAEALKSLGYEPRLLTSEARYYKLREHSREFEMAAARPRWAGGGAPGQMGRDIIGQRLKEMGTDSVFMRELQRDRARYYILLPLAMANVILTPVLILTGYIPFQGILLLFYLVGLISNQVLTLNGLAAYIQRSGFVSGLAMWISERFRDMILFAPLTFIELYGVLDTQLKDRAYAFIFTLSGGAKMDDYGNPMAGMLSNKGGDKSLYQLFRWMFLTGFFATVVNVYAIMELDLLNAMMLYPMLVFTMGLMFGPYIYMHQKGPGDSRLNWKVWVPKVMGFVVAVTILTGISLAMGIYGQMGIWTSLSLAIPFAGLFLLFPSVSALVSVNKDKKDNPKDKNNVFWHIAWAALIWGFFAVGGLVIFTIYTGSLASGLAVALVPLINLIRIVRFGINDVIETRKDEARIRTDNEKLPKEKIYEKKKKSDSSSLFVQKPFYKDPYTWETMRRSAILGITYLMWFVIVPLPALMTARILRYNLTVNYIQIGQTVFLAGLGISLILLSGAAIRNSMQRLNRQRFSDLRDLYETKRANPPPPEILGSAKYNADIARIKSFMHFMWMSFDTRAPHFGYDSLKELRRLINGLPTGNGSVPVQSVPIIDPSNEGDSTPVSAPGVETAVDEDESILTSKLDVTPEPEKFDEIANFFQTQIDTNDSSTDEPILPPLAVDNWENQIQGTVIGGDESDNGDAPESQDIDGSESSEDGSGSTGKGPLSLLLGMVSGGLLWSALTGTVVAGEPALGGAIPGNFLMALVPLLYFFGPAIRQSLLRASARRHYEDPERVRIEDWVRPVELARLAIPAIHIRLTDDELSGFLGLINKIRSAKVNEGPSTFILYAENREDAENILRSITIVKTIADEKETGDQFVLALPPTAETPVSEDPDVLVIKVDLTGDSSLAAQGVNAALVAKTQNATSKWHFILSEGDAVRVRPALDRLKSNNRSVEITEVNPNGTEGNMAWVRALLSNFVNDDSEFGLKALLKRGGSLLRLQLLTTQLVGRQA